MIQLNVRETDGLRLGSSSSSGNVNVSPDVNHLQKEPVHVLDVNYTRPVSLLSALQCLSIFMYDLKLVSHYHHSSVRV